MFLMSQILISSFMFKYMNKTYMVTFSMSVLLSMIYLKSNNFIWNSYTLFMFDTISMSLILLTFWMMILSLMASSLTFKPKKPFFMFVFILLNALVMTFLTSNFLTFYILFELTLIPILMLVMGFGYQPERINAGVYMMMYTMFGSMPLLIFILLVSQNLNLLFMPMISATILSNKMSTFWFILATLGFLMKLPMYFIHLWLPKAHVEAPLLGSMILASILLKLGGYGMILTSEMFLYSSQALKIWSPLAMLGGAFVSLLCFTQVDMKSLIAYSSVAHMSLVVGSVMTCTKWGLSSSLIIMLGHGLCSSGLFMLANLMYERSNTRSLLMNKGMISYMPSITMWWFLLCIGNMAAPPTINLLGEILAFISLMNMEVLFTVPLAIMSFFGAVFSLYLFYLTQHGKGFLMSQVKSPNKVQEMFNLFLHWAPLNITLLMSSSVLP
uniref:NADH-ubiquinone oxidoreductase chain 4 n=1 Tax=Neomysis awatschensis TaxID=1049545 RepID=A0A6M3TWS4_9CRUS|nr:NADH dehydrogenase subunit 4 [Neomysis awatschensis]